MSDEKFTLRDTRPLLEVFSVALTWSHDPPFRGRFVKGRVVFAGGRNPGQVVCCTVADDLERVNVKPLPLEGIDFPLDAKLPFQFKFFLKEGDEDIDDDRDSPVCFYWDPERPAYRPIISSVVDHSDGFRSGRAMLTYSAFRHGVLITVDPIKFMAQVKPTTTVYGDIFVFHNNYPDSKRILFKTTSQNHITVNQDSSIPLSRSQFAVPLQSIVHIVVRVYHRSGPEDDWILTKAMFNIDITLDPNPKIFESTEGVGITIHKGKRGLPSDSSYSMTSTAETSFGQSAKYQPMRGEVTEVRKKKFKSDATMIEKEDESRPEQFA